MRQNKKEKFDYFLLVGGIHSKVSSRTVRASYLQELYTILIDQKEFSKAEKTIEELIKMITSEILSIQKSQGGTSPEESIKRSMKLKREKFLDFLQTLIKIKSNGPIDIAWSSTFQRYTNQIDSYMVDPHFQSPTQDELSKLAEVKDHYQIKALFKEIKIRQQDNSVDKEDSSMTVRSNGKFRIKAYYDGAAGLPNHQDKSDVDKFVKKLKSFKPELKKHSESNISQSPQETTDELKKQVELLTEEIKLLKEIASKPPAVQPPPEHSKMDVLLSKVDRLIAVTSHKQGNTSLKSLA